MFKYPIADLSFHLNSRRIGTLGTEMISDIEKEIDAVRFKEHSKIYGMSAGGVAGIIVLVICIIIGCLCYHRKRITYLNNYVKKRNFRKHESQGIGHLFRNVKMGNSLGNFIVEQTPEEYIIKCKREEFKMYMDDYIETKLKQNKAAENRGLVDK